ncbi:hypothetical protein HYH03_009234 [Edaphochlamys debaryana]|uniref:Uncharacterized protein n=1 Tax=Edaphochlamys debaryana TaxID=47281 RepID=A0A835XYH2_9CHLO|nr:hypothetical protein HYH03_009234 [Edaphochlamys debaryana]|eukprot:KAG2492573.1 hypothetical protein HYH03_009234 [Edaphochlamys debaryana]
MLFTARLVAGAIGGLYLLLMVVPCLFSPFLFDEPGSERSLSLRAVALAVILAPIAGAASLVLAVRRSFAPVSDELAQLLSAGNGPAKVFFLELGWILAPVLVDLGLLAAAAALFVATYKGRKAKRE